MPKIEGGFSIHPTNEGLAILRREPEEAKVYYITDKGERYEIFSDPDITCGANWLKLALENKRSSRPQEEKQRGN